MAYIIRGQQEKFKKFVYLRGNYCIKGNVNVCLIFPNLPNGFETGTIKTLSLIIYVGMLVQTMFVLRLSNTISYQLFWSMIQLISRNQRAVSPEAQPRVIQPSDCEI